MTLHLEGQKFNKLTALYPTAYRRGSMIVWAFRCDCGNIAILPGPEVRSGDIPSCGCWCRPVSHKGQMKTTRNAEVVRMFEDGEPVRKIVKLFGITKQRVYQILDRHRKKSVSSVQATSIEG